MDELRKARKEARSARDEKVNELSEIVNRAATEAREFTPEEWEAKGRLTAEINLREDAVNAAEKAVKEARQAEKAALARMHYPGYALQGTGVVRITNEHRTYEKGNPEYSYLKDLCYVGFGPGYVGGDYFQAMERLQRHSMENRVEAAKIDEKPYGSRTAEEQYYLDQNIEALHKREGALRTVTSYRDLSTTTGAGGEFVPPIFQTQEWIVFMRAARALADAQHKEPLPNGTMALNLPKVTGGTSVASQNTQNAGVSDTDLTTTFVTFPVVTKAGQQIVSLQLLERSPIAFDQVVFGDMGRAYAQAVDLAVASGNGTASGNYDINGGTDVVGILNTASINTVTWTQATPLVQGFMGQIGLAKADIANTLFLPATHCFMTPTRWEWLAQSVDTTQRPLVVPSYQGPFNAPILGTDGVVVEGAVGRRISGLDTYEDANIPQNVNGAQDIVLVGRFEENTLYESPMVTRVLPQTYGNQLSVLLQVYGYIAFTAARYPNANSVITGSGLTYPPTFIS